MPFEVYASRRARQLTGSQVIWRTGLAPGTASEGKKHTFFFLMNYQLFQIETVEREMAEVYCSGISESQNPPNVMLHAACVCHRAFEVGPG